MSKEKIDFIQKNKNNCNFYSIAYLLFIIILYNNNYSTVYYKLYINAFSASHFIKLLSLKC